MKIIRQRIPDSLVVCGEHERFIVTAFRLTALVCPAIPSSCASRCSGTICPRVDKATSRKWHAAGAVAAAERSAAAVAAVDDEDDAEDDAETEAAATPRSVNEGERIAAVQTKQVQRMRV